MNVGVVAKCVRETWFVLLLCALGVLTAEALFAIVFPTFPMDLLQQFLQNVFFERLFRSLLGTDFGGHFGPEVLMSMAWVHPVMLAILWAAAITHFSRMPAMEIERGTIDLMLAMPVSRWRVFASEGFIGLTGGAMLVIAALVGCVLGSLSVKPDDRPPIGRVAIIICNLYCVYVAVGGMTGLVSALCSHRGRAIAIAFAVVITSFLIISLEQVWAPIEHFTFMSILNYYRPAAVFRDGAWPITHMAALIGFGGGCWLIGAVAFNRRSVCTV